MAKESRLQKRIAKELLANGYDQCDINQVLDNYKVRLDRAASEEEKTEIMKEYAGLYNVETDKL